MTVSFLRDFAPTQPVHELGMQPLPTGRQVYRTGKVDIGIAHEAPKMRDIGVHAEHIQTALLGANDRKFRGAMRPDPRTAFLPRKVTPTRRSLWQRLVDFVRGVR
jgi:hypothetical protein